MFNGVKILCYIILFFSFIDIKRINSIIVIPFKISELDEDNAKFYYTTNDYFTDFIQPDYYSSLNIGEKNMRILARISPDNNTFFLSEEECKRKSIENAQDYGIMTRNSYRFSQSLSYKNISQFKNGGIISENFLFYNTTKLKCHPLSYDTYLDKEIDSQINISEFKISIPIIYAEAITMATTRGTVMSLYPCLRHLGMFTKNSFLFSISDILITTQNAIAVKITAAMK